MKTHLCGGDFWYDVGLYGGSRLKRQTFKSISETFFVKPSFYLLGFYLMHDLWESVVKLEIELLRIKGMYVFVTCQVLLKLFGELW